MPYYVTTPIYYVNGEPHLGHAYTTIAADVLARHMRQRGEDVFFLTGTDEHGEPVAQAAERSASRRASSATATPCASRSWRPRSTPPTTSSSAPPTREHMAKVAEVVQRIHDNGHVYEGTYEGWYCPRCADFKTDSELEDGNRCPIHLIELESEKEDNWFFRLSAFQEPLERLYAERPDFVIPRNRYNEALSFIKERAARRLAQPRPAQVGRAGAVGRLAGDLRLDRRAAQLLLGALLRARGRGPDRALLAGDGPPDRQGHPQVPRGHLAGDADGGRARGAAAGGHPRLPADGRAQDVQVARQRASTRSRSPTLYGADALRFYLLREVSFGQDGEVSPEGFETRYNTELANEYGNLASRTLAMIGRYRDGVVPEAT